MPQLSEICKPPGGMFRLPDFLTEPSLDGIFEGIGLRQDFQLGHFCIRVEGFHNPLQIADIVGINFNTPDQNVFLFEVFRTVTGPETLCYVNHPAEVSEHKKTGIS